jgi:transcription antitermination factor NusA-like protein
MVEADLPDACNVASSNITKKEDRPVVERSAKKRAVNTLAECIKDSFDKNNSNELMNKKIEFMSYEKSRKERVFNLMASFT